MCFRHAIVELFVASLVDAFVALSRLALRAIAPLRLGMRSSCFPATCGSPCVVRLVVPPATHATAFMAQAQVKKSSSVHKV